MSDRRVKGCANPDCRAYKKIRYKTEEAFCSHCGGQLKYVCAKCGTPLAYDDKNVRICEKCQAKLADRREGAKKIAEEAGQVAVAIGTVVAPVIKFAPEIPKMVTKIIKK